MSDFDQAASSWDQKASRHQRAKQNAGVIRRHLKISPNALILDFGCGTGLLGFEFESEGTLLFTDTSSAMLEEVKKKRKSAKTFLWPSEKEKIRQLHPNIIVSQMVLHHIEDLKSLAKDLFDILPPKAWIALIDLKPEDGSFHDGKHRGRLGIEPKELEEDLLKAGFCNIRFTDAPPIEKNQTSYPLFLCIAQKPS